MRTTRRAVVGDDITACGTGVNIPTAGERLSGAILVPGYGPFHGMKMDEVAERAIELAPSLREDWSSPEVVLRDIRWLCEEGMSISR